MTRWRWALLAVVLAVAGTVALWPRSGDAPSEVGQDAGRRLTEARATAALRPCPLSTLDTPGPAPLAGVRVTCLGDGSPIDLGPALAGRPTLINVWASWCQPCREEQPILDAYATSLDAVSVLGVQVLSDPADGLDLLASLGVHLPSVHDRGGTVSAALHLPKFLPVSYVVRHDGTVHQVEPPAPFTSPDQVHQTVQRYLTEGPPADGP